MRAACQPTCHPAPARPGSGARSQTAHYRLSMPAGAGRCTSNLPLRATPEMYKLSKSSLATNQLREEECASTLRLLALLPHLATRRHCMHLPSSGCCTLHSTSASQLHAHSTRCSPHTAILYCSVRSFTHINSTHATDSPHTPLLKNSTRYSTAAQSFAHIFLGVERSIEGDERVVIDDASQHLFSGRGAAGSWPPA